MSKPFYKSKMFWFNILAFIVAVAAQFGYEAELPADFEAFVLPVVFLINLALRFVTKEPISLS